jgi:SM-20-related protein
MTAPSRNHDIEAGIVIIDDVLRPEEHLRLYQFLAAGSWRHGWSSRSDTGAFWHRHFVGPVNEDDVRARGQGSTDFSDELRRAEPILHDFWSLLRGRVFHDHGLQRCYANALPYGTDGATHTDSLAPGDYTAIYYPHETWDSDWGGETIIFNRDRSDILAAVYPKPNRLLIFPGFVHHMARGVSRACPAMRITLMFKTRRLVNPDARSPPRPMTVPEKPPSS